MGPGLEKAPTGIRGLDQITGGGLPGAGYRWWRAAQERASRCWGWNSWSPGPASTASPACW